MFQTSHPVAGPGFHDRKAEVERLESFLDELRAGSARWLAVIGPRKVGKTSLLLELSRRASDIDFVLVDTLENTPPSLDVFRACALRLVDQLFAAELGNSLEVLAAGGASHCGHPGDSARFAAPPSRMARCAAST